MTIATPANPVLFDDGGLAYAPPLWNPSQLPGSPLVVNFDALVASSVAVNGSGQVTSWTDLVSGIVATPGANLPRYSSTARNNLPGITLKAQYSEVLSTPGEAAFPSGTSASTIVVVGYCDQTGTAAYTGAALGTGSGTGQSRGVLYNNGVIDCATGSNDQPLVESWGSRDAIVISMIASGANPLATAVVNGGNPETATLQTLSTPASPALHIGGFGTSYGFFDGVIQQVMLFNRVLTSDEYQRLAAWLAWRWAQQANLPANQPYKSAPPPETQAYSMGFGEVNGAPAVVDIGSSATSWNGVAVINVNAIKTSAGNEAYALVIQGALASDPTFQNPVPLASIQVATAGQYQLPFYAYNGSNLYRYQRLEKVLTGSSPSITVQSFAIPYTGLSQMQLADLVSLNLIVAQNLVQVSASVLAWATGLVNGGPNGDGRYPLNDASGNTFLVACPAKQLATSSNPLAGLAPLSVGLFTSLSQLSIPAGTGMIRTSGFGVTGQGSAAYIDAGSTTLAASGQGGWWQTTANGRTFMLLAVQSITPAMFGAPLNGSADDATAIQAAHNFILAQGRGAIDLENRTYHCLSELTIEPTAVGMIGRGAMLDFSARTFTNPGLSTEVISDPTFTKGNWQNGTLTNSSGQRQNFTFGTSGAVSSDTTGASSTSLYGDCGIQVSLIPGQRYRLTYTIANLQYSGATSSQDYVSFGLQNGSGAPTSNGIGYGGDGGIGITVYGPINSPTTGTFDFNAPADAGQAGGLWFEIKSSNECTVTSVSIKLLPNNTCALISSAAGAPQYGQSPQRYEGFTIKGAQYATGLVFQTMQEPQSSRIACHNINILGCDTQVQFMDRAYIIQLYGCTFQGGVGAYFVNNAQDAGENISFFGCTFFNGSLCVWNDGGAELFFFGCSFDYSNDWLKGGGTMAFDACHFEQNKPTDGSCPIQAYGGAVMKFSKSYFLESGGSVNQPTNMPALFSTAGYNDLICLTDCHGYNWQSNTDQLMTGPGRIRVTGYNNSSNPNSCSAPSRNSNASLLGVSGKFAAGVIGVDAYLNPYAPGGRTTPTDRTDAALSSGSNTGTAQIAPTTSVNRSAAGGSAGSLQVTRTTTGGSGWSNPNQGSGFQLCIPISRVIRAINIEAYFLVPNYKLVGVNLGTKTSTQLEIYCEAYFRQMLYRDSLGRPVFSENNLFFGEQKPCFDTSQAGDGNWWYIGFNTQYYDQNSGGGQATALSPEWANCITIDINEANLPSGSGFNLTDLSAWEWR